jgi:hypothetical protein
LAVGITTTKGFARSRADQDLTKFGPSKSQDERGITFQRPRPQRDRASARIVSIKRVRSSKKKEKRGKVRSRRPGLSSQAQNSFKPSARTSHVGTQGRNDNLVFQKAAFYRPCDARVSDIFDC